MASENDPTTTDATVDAVPAVDVSAAEVTEQAPEKPKRRRATKKAAAPAAEPAADAPAADEAAAEVAPEAEAVEAPVKKATRKRAAKKATEPRRRPRRRPRPRPSGPRRPPRSTRAVAEVLAAPVVETADERRRAPTTSSRTTRLEVETAGGRGGRRSVVPSFGLLFQAPEPVAPRRRRATAPAQAPAERVAEDEPAAASSAETDGDAEGDTPATEGDTEAAARPPRLAAAVAAAADAPGEAPRLRAQAGDATESADAGETADTTGTADASDEADGPRATAGPTTDHRRGRGRLAQPPPSRGPRTPRPQPGRRRPGRHGIRDVRRRRDEAGGTGPDDQGDEGEGGTSRRRRRRRRGGSGDGENEDPPGTTTRVREPRSQRDEPTAVKGSTRLEAKKQRRREGREAGRRRTIITEAEFLARRESVERVMVVRGRGDRTQIGVLEDGVLVEHYVSRETTASMAGNVYLGRVQNVLPSMEAAFVDIGKGRNAVLYAGEVNWDAAGLEGGQARRIENALSSGDTVLTQVTKDPIGHKGARLTSQISLPGRYLVYVPEGQMTGISRKLPDTERARLKAILKEVVPDHAGVIVRTAAEGASEEELRADVERLTKIWDKIKAKAESAGAKKAGSGGAPALLHGEPDLTVRVIRDVFTEDFTSLVVSGDKAWGEVSQYVEDVAPDLAPRLQRWTAEEDVFAAHRIDESLAKAMDRKVWLPSGGSLVIDRTEAMTVVDVNTGKFVGSGGNLEETVTKNNLEAAEEIVRQLRLRDIGGIIVIDFIDMVLGVQPRPRRAPPARVPRARPHQAPGRRGHLARPGADDPQAGRVRPGRGLLRAVRALRWARHRRAHRADRPQWRHQRWRRRATAGVPAPGAAAVARPPARPRPAAARAVPAARTAPRPTTPRSRPARPRPRSPRPPTPRPCAAPRPASTPTTHEDAGVPDRGARGGRADLLRRHDRPRVRRAGGRVRRGRGRAEA